MQIQFTPNTGLTPVTLGDDGSKFAVVVEQLGGACVAQSETLAGGANLALFPRGNVGGEFVFRSSKTYASYHATFAQFQTEYGRLNQQGTLTLIEGAVTLTFANAVLKAVQRIFDGQHSGSRMGIRYTFAITTIS
ncbi:MAG TPA: hypothetical protein VN761_03850 [Candidatus Polarisedimenticolia bacterium]|nr:hypothetical protein [Candidatus Polarisedimenticolia bacterium]